VVMSSTVNLGVWSKVNPQFTQRFSANAAAFPRTSFLHGSGPAQVGRPWWGWVYLSQPWRATKGICSHFLPRPAVRPALMKASSPSATA